MPDALPETALKAHVVWRARCPYCEQASQGGFSVMSDEPFAERMGEKDAVSWHDRHMRDCPQRPATKLPYVEVTVSDTDEVFQ